MSVFIKEKAIVKVIGIQGPIWKALRGLAIVSATPPSDPYIGMLWLDISQQTEYLKIFDGNDWVMGTSMADIIDGGNL